MNALEWLLVLYFGFMFITLLLAIFIFPYRKIVWNRWKLRIGNLRGKSLNPCFIVFPDKSVAEIVVDTSQDTFNHLNSTYNIRPNKFYTIFGFKYLLYINDNPEPQDLHIDEKGLIALKTEGGELIHIPIMDVFKQPNGKYVAGRVIDGKTYDNLLVRSYNAGLAWMARNSNILNILLYVVIALVVVCIGVSYWQETTTQKVCLSVLQNITTQTSRIL